MRGKSTAAAKSSLTAIHVVFGEIVGKLKRILCFVTALPSFSTFAIVQSPNPNFHIDLCFGQTGFTK